MTTREMAARIGTTGTLRSNDGFWVLVKVVDVKVAYGDVRFLVCPEAGAGTVWVSETRVDFPVAATPGTAQLGAEVTR